MSRAGQGRTRGWFRFPVWREFFGAEELLEWRVPLAQRPAAPASRSPLIAKPSVPLGTDGQLNAPRM
jgi:hypothetical protein